MRGPHGHSARCDPKSQKKKIATMRRSAKCNALALRTAMRNVGDSQYQLGSGLLCHYLAVLCEQNLERYFGFKRAGLLGIDISSWIHGSQAPSTQVWYVGHASAYPG